MEKVGMQVLGNRNILKTQMHMKRMYFFLAAAMMVIGMMAQNHSTKFLGIPIDGAKQEMIRNIQSKGFIYNRQLDCFTGVFNGEKVVVALRTYNEKVCQVSVINLQTYSEKQVKDKFNNLMKQFNNHPNYISATLDQTYIDKKERLSKEITKNGKKYAAYYLQITHDLDTTIWMKDMDRITQGVVEQLADRDSISEHEKDLVGQYIEQKAMIQQYLNNIVWFRIIENNGKYSIALYYDNLYNQPSGSDL